MAILPLVIAPDPLLKQVSMPVEAVTDEIRAFLDDMLETMYHEDGAGLAAVQVGVLKRILVIDVTSKGEKSGPYFMVNPEITWSSPESCTHNEGCLSFPEQRLEVKRPAIVKVSFLDYDGKHQELEADDWLATAVQHEMDHLNGIVLPDHASALKKDMIMRKAVKIKKLIAQQ